jgi:NADH-ubiquinone oxidoreductase chain 5
MMVIAIGLSCYNIALFHLVNHAFYKALLFLGAGSVIHAVADNQDFRKYGGLINYLPLTYSVMLIASLSLAAFPFMTGFYSKDFILESAYGQFSLSGITVYIIATIGAIFTTLYSVKVLYLTFLTRPNGSRKYWATLAHEGNIYMTLPLVVLAIFSIFFGFITKDLFIGLGCNFFGDNSLFIHPMHEIMIDTEFAVPTLFKLLPFIFTIFFSFTALTLSDFFPELIIYFKASPSKLGYNIFGFFNQRFLVELFYNKYISNMVLELGGQTTKILDKGSIELLGPFGLEKGLIFWSKSINNLNTSIVTNYALYIFLFFTVYIFVYNLPIDGSIFFLFILLMGFLLTKKNPINNAILNSQIIVFKCRYYSNSSNSGSNRESSPEENLTDLNELPFAEEREQVESSERQEEESPERLPSVSVAEEESPEENSSDESSSQGDGYETDSNRSYWEQGDDAMVAGPPKEIPLDQLRRYIKDTDQISRFPKVAHLEGDQHGTMRQFYADRNRELRDEYRRRQQEGIVEERGSVSPYPDPIFAPSEAGSPSGSSSGGSPAAPSGGGLPSGSSSGSGPAAPSGDESGLTSDLKRKRSNDDLPEESKRFKQDSSDLTNQGLTSNLKRKRSNDDLPEESKRFKQDSSDLTNQGLTSGLKRKRSNDDLPEESKRFKQDSSDLTNEGEMPSYGWEDGE